MQVLGVINISKTSGMTSVKARFRVPEILWGARAIKYGRIIPFYYNKFRIFYNFWGMGCSHNKWVVMKKSRSVEIYILWNNIPCIENMGAGVSYSGLEYFSNCFYRFIKSIKK